MVHRLEWETELTVGQQDFVLILKYREEMRQWDTLTKKHPNNPLIKFNMDAVDKKLKRILDKYPYLVKGEEEASA